MASKKNLDTKLLKFGMAKMKLNSVCTYYGTTSLPAFLVAFGDLIAFGDLAWLGRELL